MTVARARDGAAWVHLVLAGAIVAGVFAQVYLIGAYVFGAGNLTTHAGIGIPDDHMEHEGGRKVATPGHYRCSGFQGRAETPLLGKTRARLLIQAGDGIAEGRESLIGGAKDGVRLDPGQILDTDPNHRPASSRPRRYIS